jgi:hypothetical protein
MGNQASLARPPIQCDAECEREKRIIELKSAYQTATKDETKDTDEVRLARKQYYTYTYGQNAFDGLEEKALGKVADANIKKLQSKYNELLNEIKEQKGNKKSYSIALKNMNELLSKFNNSNTAIMSSLDKQEDVLETSRRNVWYTNQRIDRLDYYGYFVGMVLNILLIVAIVFFMYDKKYVSLIVVIVSAILISWFT